MATQLSSKQIVAIKRKRGELGLSVSELARQVDLSRRTIYNVFTKPGRPITSTTYRKLSNWLIDEYATADINDSQTVAAQSKQRG